MPQVGTRWTEYSEQEHAQLASLAFDMLNRGGVTCGDFVGMEFW